MENDVITPPLEAGQEALTSSGGWSAHPLLYDIFPPIDIKPFELPMFTTQRGGITYNTGSTWSSPKLTKEERFLTMALGVALTSKCRFMHGAIVVKHSKILGSSPNIYKNNPKHSPIESCSVHAEMAAMRKAGWPRKASLYVARINGKGEKRLSKPCATCAAVLEDFKVKVFWTE